jgi:hypothetical protein
MFAFYGSGMGFYPRYEIITIFSSIVKRNQEFGLRIADCGFGKAQRKPIYSASKTWSLGPVHDPVSRGSEYNGSAGTSANTFGVLEYWSTGVLAKTKA